MQDGIHNWKYNVSVFTVRDLGPCTRTRTLQRACLRRLAFIHSILAVLSKGSYIDKSECFQSDFCCRKWLDRNTKVIDNGMRAIPRPVPQQTWYTLSDTPVGRAHGASTVTWNFEVSETEIDTRSQHIRL